MIERLIAAVERIPESAIPNILSALSDILDDVALSTRDGDWGQHRSWGAAEQLVEGLMRKVTDPAIRRDCIARLFTEGRAIGWQTSLLRSEIFAHGHYGERAEPEAQRLLTPAEFQQVLATRFMGSSRRRGSPPLAPWCDASKASATKPCAARPCANKPAVCSFTPPPG